MNRKDYNEEYALSFLPISVAQSVRLAASLYKGVLSEIRLRENAPVYITVNGRNIRCSEVCTVEMLKNTVNAVCGHSMYCHTDTIKAGYISTENGMRIGVCGRAVTENGEIRSVNDIKSLCIRIPHRFPGCADELCRIIMEKNFRGMIIFSPPGIGKTTALREICARLGKSPYDLRIAVVDTRFEICSFAGDAYTVDALSGYPRAKGIETAVRCLSPQLIICDEIGSDEDREALNGAMCAGVPTVVTVHAGSFNEIKGRPFTKSLMDSGMFSHAVLAERRDGNIKYTVREVKEILCSELSVVC